jgi:hypothetical protein
MLDRTHIAGEAGLVVTVGTYAAVVANEVLTQLFDLRSGLDAAPLQLPPSARQVAIAWGSCDVRVLILDEAHCEVRRIADDWPLAPIRTEGLPDAAAARRELAALLAAARRRAIEPVWLVGRCVGHRDVLANLLGTLERHGMSDTADRLRRLAELRPGADPVEALRADGFGALVDRLNDLIAPPRPAAAPLITG